MNILSVASAQNRTPLDSTLQFITSVGIQNAA